MVRIKNRAKKAKIITKPRLSRACQPRCTIDAHFMDDGQLFVYWSISLKFVQFIKNRAHSAKINMIPYKVMVGVDPRVERTSSNLPDDIIDTTNVDNELKNLTGSQTGHKIRIEQEVAGMFSNYFIPTDEKKFYNFHTKFSLDIIQVRDICLLRVVLLRLRAPHPCQTYVQLDKKLIQIWKNRQLT